MALVLVITTAGRQALVNASHTGTTAVTIASVGVSPTAVTPSPSTSALPGEVKRIATISGDQVAADTIHLVVRDETMDVYSVRSFALYLADGTLFAVYGQPGVILEKSAQALLLLAVDVTLADISATQITFGNANFIDPPATTERAGVVELATDAEAAALTDALRALTPRGANIILSAANIIARLMTVDGSGSGLDADLLDGRQATEFALLSGANFSGSIASPFVSVAGGQSPFGQLVVGSTGDNAVRTIAVANANSILGIGARIGAGAGSIVSYSYTSGGQGPLVFANASGEVARFGPLGGFNVAGAITQSNNQVWHTGNDGAGSGLDADLLDGRQASEFALLAGATFSGSVTTGGNLVAAGALQSGTTAGFGECQLIGSGPTGIQSFSMRQGVVGQSNGGWSLRDLSTGANRIEVSASGAVNVPGALTQAGSQVWHTANDGAGSGLDADLIDGRHADAFALLSGAAFTGGITRAGAAVWDAINDGSGSGLDADLLDGWHRDAVRDWSNLLNRPGSYPPSAHTHGAADIAPAFASHSFGSDGYQVFPGGLIVQWVAGYTMPADTQSTQFITFPLSFPNLCLRTFVSTEIQGVGNLGDAFFQTIGSAQNGVTVLRQLTTNEADNIASTPFVLAIGY